MAFCLRYSLYWDKTKEEIEGVVICDNIIILVDPMVYFNVSWVLKYRIIGRNQRSAVVDAVEWSLNLVNAKEKIQA